MSDKRFIENLYDIVGKTVEKVVKGCDKVLIRFTDGTFIGIESDDDGWVYELDPDNLSPSELRNIGAIDEQEYAKRVEERKRQDQASRHADYLRLKAEFEN